MSDKAAIKLCELWGVDFVEPYKTGAELWIEQAIERPQSNVNIDLAKKAIELTNPPLTIYGDIEMNITRTHKIKPFNTPNYVRAEGVEMDEIHISELSDADLIKLCDKFKEEVLKKARKARVEREVQ